MKHKTLKEAMETVATFPLEQLRSVEQVGSMTTHADMATILGVAATTSKVLNLIGDAKHTVTSEDVFDSVVVCHFADDTDVHVVCQKEMHVVAGVFCDGMFQEMFCSNVNTEDEIDAFLVWLAVASHNKLASQEQIEILRGATS